ncbi:MAG: 6-phosphogluconolactonase [Clostridiales bacterium]|nr:6-phosphogluconolactonase [Clostridiales bacterium]
MKLTISENAVEMGEKAAERVAELIRAAVEEKGHARILVSTGQSQFEYFEALVKKEIPWNQVEIFHLDEYIGLPITHKASFRKYLKERFVNFIPGATMHYLNVDEDVEKTITEITEEILKDKIDVGIIGIGENGHIAFNDPPADFETTASYHVVKLDEKCRNQQVGEGWFPTVTDVPEYALSATIWQIMQCEHIVSVVPHTVKAQAVKKTLETAEVTNLIPATKLREHKAWELFLDRDSASMLEEA